MTNLWKDTACSGVDVS